MSKNEPRIEYRFGNILPFKARVKFQPESWELIKDFKSFYGDLTYEKEYMVSAIAIINHCRLCFILENDENRIVFKNTDLFILIEEVK